MLQHTSRDTNICHILYLCPQKLPISGTCPIKQLYLRVDASINSQDWSVCVHAVSLCCLGTGDKHPPLLCLIPYLLERASLEQPSVTAALFISTLTEHGPAQSTESTFQLKMLYVCLPAVDIPGQLRCERKWVFIFELWAIFRNYVFSVITRCICIKRGRRAPRLTIPTYIPWIRFSMFPLKEKLNMYQRCFCWTSEADGWVCRECERLENKAKR